MLKKFLLLILLVSCCSLGHLLAQQLDYRQGEVIFCLHKDADLAEVISRHDQHTSRSTQFKVERCLSNYLNIWKGSFDYTRIHEKKFVQALASDPDIVIAQLNHFLSRRSIPNDPLLDNQWQWINMGVNGIEDADIDADEAWDLSTGGLTIHGDTIVVASIDVGVDYAHQDLRDNLWTNSGEIPGNRVDDDENGYVDDYMGWNVLLENDNIEPELFAGGIPETHGTEIFGIVGAVGNNDEGVTGVNWNVKVMNIFFNSDLNEADMIGAYAYILDQRRLYNETGGEKGAYVVATNLSYGDEELTPDDTPIWCSFYDSLGAQGIINCIATSNNPLNLDTLQDVPSSCSSEFMLAVTASDENDERTFAAYGKNDIDLAAPGDQVYTTSIPDYGFVQGTSYAAPMVAGAIGMMYASPCGDLSALSKADPAAAARMARDLILNGVDKLDHLENEVASGGRLNVNNALLETMNTCTSCIAAFGHEVEAGRDNAVISWSVSDSVSQTTLQYRLLSDTTWTTMEDVQSPVTVEGLSSCTEYAYQLITTCLDETSITTNILGFETNFCCEEPGDVVATMLSADGAQLTWDTILAAEDYLVRWTLDGDSLAWDSILIDQPAYQLTGLRECSEYLIQVQTLCMDGGVEFGDTTNLRTLGCGACLDSTYCVPTINATGDEWIEQVTFHTLDNISGYNQGYGDFGGEFSTTLKQGNSYPLVITPGFVDTTMEEFFFVWMDYNQDGVFDNDTELIHSADTAHVGTLTTNVRIPTTSAEGLTRMRILLLYEPVDDVVTPCGTEVDLGEMEDYCIEIVFDSLLCPPPENVDTINFMGTSTDITWEKVDSAIAYTIRYRKVGDEEWEEAADTANQYSLSELEECSEYEVQVQAVCAADTSGYTESFVFATQCETNIDELAPDITVKVFPNPFVDYLTIDIDTGEALVGQMELIQLDGRRIWHQNLGSITGNQRFDVHQAGNLIPGIYLLKLNTSRGTMVRKLIKQ